jgi:hypothetical protein
VRQQTMSNEDLEELAEDIASIRLEMNAILFPLPAPVGVDHEAWFEQMTAAAQHHVARFAAEEAGANQNKKPE